MKAIVIKSTPTSNGNICSTVSIDIVKTIGPVKTTCIIKANLFTADEIPVDTEFDTAGFTLKTRENGLSELVPTL